MEENAINFSAVLKGKRTRYGVSQRKLSILSGYSREHINRIENEKEIPSEKMKETLLTSLEILNLSLIMFVYDLKVMMFHTSVKIFYESK